MGTRMAIKTFPIPPTAHLDPDCLSDGQCCSVARGHLLQTASHLWYVALIALASRIGRPGMAAKVCQIEVPQSPLPYLWRLCVKVVSLV